MNVEIVDSPGPAASLAIELMESLLGFGFPGPYRLFLQKFNGGWPVPDEFDFELNGDPNGSIVDGFCSLDVGGNYDLENMWNIFKARVPNKMVPIARDPGGNLILIGLAGEVEGKVYFWDHEEEADDDEEPDMTNVYLISDNFDDFLDSLYESEDIS
jgi:hypothetical protein